MIETRAPARIYGRMMTTRAILTTLALGVAVLLPATHAQEPQPAAPAAQTEQAQHPFFQFDLYPRWSQLTPEQGMADVRRGMEIARAKMEALCSLKPEEMTYENTFAQYEEMTDELGSAEVLLYHLSCVMDSPEVRAAQEALLPETSAFYSALSANEQLWATIKAAAAQPWVRTLSAQKQRYVQQVVDSFKDSGADLPADKKARKAEIEKELSELTLKFGKNVLDSTNAWELVIKDKAQLAGMSEDWMSQAAAAALEKGYGTEENPQWLVTLQLNSYYEVLRYCDVEETRRLVRAGRNTVGNTPEFDNAPLVARVMELRRELATLLGFGTFADLKAARRMVGSGERAMSFVDEMMHKVKPAFDRETNEMLAYVSRCKGEQVTAMKPWDTGYYSRKYAEELYNLDKEELRPYFECNRVCKGMFSIFEHLLGIRIEELPAGAVDVWHPEVKVYTVHDKATGNHLGSFYMDLFPRTTKRAGAWVMPLHAGDSAKDGKPHAPHLGALCGNMTPATEDKPALLSHYDVQVLFHEFGHMMHVMMGDTELRSHTGTSVAWDFVEQPSQMFENWVWEPESLSLFAFHHETGELMPREMMDKLRQGRFFMPASENMGQLCIAKLDLEIHVNYNEKFKGRCLDEESNALLAPWRMPTTEQGPSLMRHITHCITGGYAAGYYSYKWAEVLAADGFTRFSKEGIMNENVGAEYRKYILSKGDSEPPAEIFRQFMGREFNPDALLQIQGLEAAK